MKRISRYKKYIFFLLAILCLNVMQAQEVLTGLSHNPSLMNQEKNRMKNTSSVTLPFFDDFSNYTGYPKTSLWADKQAFVNNSFPLYPPTIGVATLDALDENGVIYTHAETRPFGADTLTSNLIRLDYNNVYHRLMQVSDSVYFSFYYQPGGASRSYPPVEWERIGDRPETDDSLVVEFGYATGDSMFIGYAYSDYELPYNEHGHSGDSTGYVPGDSLLNPFLLPDTVYFVFDFYANVGASIELPSDSLYGPVYRWNHVWATSGCKVDDWLNEDEHHLCYFKKVMIPITDPQYFRNNFQFRFRNYASLEPKGYDAWASNVDQWHIDYVSLEQGGSYTDIYPHDVAFVMPTTSALKEYQSMPWNQYRSSDMKESFHNDMSNLSSSVINVSYSYRVVSENGSLIAEQPRTSENAPPYYYNGLYVNPYHTDPAIAYVYPYDGADSALFKITHVFNVTGGAGDDCIANDTCVFLQKFYNYYAYDDGTAEGGYSLVSALVNPENYLAVRFTLAQADTLRGVRMWFNSVLDNANVEPFTLMVWDDDYGEPGNVLFSMANQWPAHAENPSEFVYYEFEEPFVVSGTFYVGTYQTQDVPLNIGFDQNNDARAHWVYSTSGEWKEPFLYGAPMIRPVLGKYFDCTPVRDIDHLQFSVYPNPADQQITVVLENVIGHSCEAIMYDMTGRKVAEFILNDNYNILNISSLESGIYLLQVKSENQTTFKKIIKR
jgi:hypothetical protein